MTSKSPDGDPENVLGPTRARLVADEAETMPVRDPRRIAASVAMFERLSEHWSLRGDERETLLGGIPKSTWSEWRQRPPLARIKADTRERIANLFAIDLNAHSLFAPEFADRWVRQSNVAFGNDSPMSTMLRGKVEDIIFVRRYLEGVRASSPQASVRSESETPTVSALPGDAIESDETDAALPALREAAAIYERLALQEAAQYRPALAMALGALATRLEQRDDAEAASVLRRAVEIQAQLAFERPPDEAETDGPDGAYASLYQSYLERGAADVMLRIGMLDASFNPVLLARIREIERQPFAYKSFGTSGHVRIANMTHRGVTWKLVFAISETRQRLHILSIELAPAAAS